MTSARVTMHFILRSRRLKVVPLLAIHLFSIAMSTKQCCGETALERALNYANQVSELNHEFDSTYSQTESVYRHAQQLTKKFRETGLENSQIEVFGVHQQMIVEFQSLSRALENNSWLLPNNANLARSDDLGDRQLAASRLQLHQLLAAKQLSERRIKGLVVELQTLSKELHDLTQKSNRFFPNYLQLADVYGMRTRLEWKAALREVANASESNLGARYFRAVTLRRLGKFELAESEFMRLATLSTPMQPLFLAARAEALVLAGNTRDGKRLLGSIQGEARKYAGVQGYRGLIAAFESDWRTAVAAWNVDLGKSKHEVAIRRNIAIGLSKLSKKNPHNAERALEQIQLADDASGKDEWSVRLATAHVYMAIDDKPKAIDSAEQAAQMTSAYSLVYCEDSLKRIQQGVAPEWDFIDH